MGSSGCWCRYAASVPAGSRSHASAMRGYPVAAPRNSCTCGWRREERTPHSRRKRRCTREYSSCPAPAPDAADADADAVEPAAAPAAVAGVAAASVSSSPKASTRTLICRPCHRAEKARKREAPPRGLGFNDRDDDDGDDVADEDEIGGDIESAALGAAPSKPSLCAASGSGCKLTRDEGSSSQEEGKGIMMPLLKPPPTPEPATPTPSSSS